MTEIQLVWSWARARIQTARTPSDAGFDIVQTAIIIALFSAAAITIVGILVAKATDAANRVKTQ